MEESLPNITGHANAYAYKSAPQYATSVFTMNDVAANVISSGSSSGYNYMDINFYASRSSSTYQDNAHVRPLSIATAFLIRY